MARMLVAIPLLLASTHGAPLRLRLANRQRPVSSTERNFICVTMDWWPANKCDYEGENGRTHKQACSWAVDGVANGLGRSLRDARSPGRGPLFLRTLITQDACALVAPSAQAL